MTTECIDRSFDELGVASRIYKEFRYETRQTWSRQRRVIGKAEHVGSGIRGVRVSGTHSERVSLHGTLR